MSKLVVVNKHFTKDSNFWNLNPQLTFMKPFSELYERDKTKDKSRSSTEMWFIFFMTDSDEDENKFYRIPEKERKEMLLESFLISANEEDELIKRCIEIYPVLCLDSIERTLKEQKDYLVKRSKAITEMDYNFETMKNIDYALGQSLKINTEYAKIEELFQKDKKTSIIRGGRKMTLSEKGDL